MGSVHWTTFLAIERLFSQYTVSRGVRYIDKQFILAILKKPIYRQFWIFFENIDIAKKMLKNIDIDIAKVISGNIDIDIAIS